MGRASRLGWVLATLAIAAIAATVAWNGENHTFRELCCVPYGVLRTPYYLVVFAWSPLVALVWFTAGAVALARRVKYRGRWFWAAQVLVTVLMVIRIAGMLREGGLPVTVAGGENMSVSRWVVLGCTAAAFVASLVASTMCMVAAFQGSPTSGLTAE